MNKAKKLIFNILVLLCLINANNALALEATPYLPGNLIIIPDYENYFDPEYFYAFIYIQPVGQAVNATEINLNFSNEILSVASIDYTDSFCALFIHEKIDNTNGNLNIQCGRPNGMSGDNLFVAKITFNKLSADWAKLDLNGSQILLNDGLGTNIAEANNIYNILIEK